MLTSRCERDRPTDLNAACVFRLITTEHNWNSSKINDNNKKRTFKNKDCLQIGSLSRILFRRIIQPTQGNPAADLNQSVYPRVLGKWERRDIWCRSKEDNHQPGLFVHFVKFFFVFFFLLTFTERFFIICFNTERYRKNIYCSRNKRLI